ncbi:MAG: hypothetical protein K5683_07715 [Prevotella sp.]|nr:hypothetical protein [Prevotella sp.]
MRRFLLLLTIAYATVSFAMPEGENANDTLPTFWKQQAPAEWPTLEKAALTMTDAFKHLDLSLTMGSTGIGFDVSMPLNNTFALRAGYAFMPHFKQAMHFGVDVGDNPAESQSKFERLSGMLEDLMGYKVDNEVIMDGMPTYWNWKLMVDIKPFRNKHWHITAGVYGGNRQVGKAVNTIKDMPSLVAVNVYNQLYYKAANDLPIINLNGSDIYLNDPSSQIDLKSKFLSYGQMSIHIGDYTEDVLYEEDVVSPYDQFIGDDYYAEGDIIHHKGDVMIAKGSPYRMVPDENAMVKAFVYANRYKPYLGFGYGGQLFKNDDSWQISFDCGAMFWGGTPEVVTHDGTDLVNDVKNVRGKVGDYINIINHFKAFPVLNIRITKRIF